jgi:hypothetical protein
MTKPRTPHPPPAANALAIALADRDWERAALLLMLGVAQVVSTLPRETIDDVLALLELDGGRDGDR